MLAQIPVGFFTDTYNVDATSKQQQINDLTNYVSVKDIVKTESDNNFLGQKNTFKVKLALEPTNDSEEPRAQKSYKFISVRVKPQPYLG